MILLLLLFNHNKSDNVFQNCNSHYVNDEINQINFNEYIISCHPDNKNYTIRLEKFDRFKTIQIYDNPNVLLICSEKIYNIGNVKIEIYDHPTIYFQDCDSYEEDIIIHGSPSLFSNVSISFDKVIIYNKTYKFPFESNDIDYSQNIPSITEKRYNCKGGLNYYLSNDITISCHNTNYFTIPYSRLQYFIFFFLEEKTFYYPNEKKIYSYIKFINNSVDDNHVEEYLKTIISLTYYYNLEKIKIFYANFYYKPELLQSSLNLFNEDVDIRMTIDWDNIIESYNTCPWYDAIYLKNKAYMKDYFDQLVNKFRWTKICIDEGSFLTYMGEKE